jgi:putative ABC transport system substrate-binding protein
VAAGGAGAASRARVRRIGVMASLAADDRVAQIRNGAFLQGLQQAGWNVGRNVSIEYRWAGIGEAARRHAAELVALAPAVILAGGSQAATPLVQITQTIPVVFVHTPDPVGSGLVSSLAQPGGNATGFTQFEYGIAGKWLELLKEIAPAVTRAAVIRDPAITAGIGMFGAIQSAAPSLGVEVSPVNVRDPSEMERGITAFARFGNGGLIVTASALTRSRLLGIARSTRQSRCRASAPYRAPGSLTVIRQRVRGSAASVSVAEWSVDKSSQSTTSPTS